jgi:hypothetical protein
MGGCLFGSNLRGTDHEGNTFPLIKYDIKLFDKQKISGILFNSKELRSYEKVIFSELEKIAELMNKLSLPLEKKYLNYHLPYYDYLIFGIGLLIRDQITYPAFNKLFELVKKRRELHIGNINTVFEKHEINIKVQSPFDNLFGPIETLANVNDMFDKLELNIQEINGFSIEERVDKEKNFIDYCLQKLSSNTYFVEQGQAWQDFINIRQSNSMLKIESLIQQAHIVMVACQVRGKSNLRCCFLLPSSEKQNQLAYDRYYAESNAYYLKRDEISPYPSLLNITFPDPFLGYSPQSRGSMFCFEVPDCEKPLVQLVDKKQLVRYAYANAGLFSTGSQSITLEAVMDGSNLEGGNTADSVMKR